MLSSITSWVEDKATGYLRTGIQAGGSLAGNAVGGVGGLVENAGKSAAQGVQGGIGSVGGYISGYGNTIQRSMSADGPVSSAPKKTAVKPSAPGAQKALPASAGPRKAPPTTKSATPQRALPSTKPATTSRVGGPTAVKPQGPGVSKPGSNPTKSAHPPQKTASSVNSSGKVVPSQASRPKPVARKPAAAGGASTAGKSGDILGIGNKPKSQQPNNSSRKPSASDPLAIGADVAQIGKKK